MPFVLDVLYGNVNYIKKLSVVILKFKSLKYVLK